jgi:hypothetical protein
MKRPYGVRRAMWPLEAMNAQAARSQSFKQRSVHTSSAYVAVNEDAPNVDDTEVSLKLYAAECRLRMTARESALFVIALSNQTEEHAGRLGWAAIRRENLDSGDAELSQIIAVIGLKHLRCPTCDERSIRLIPLPEPVLQPRLLFGCSSCRLLLFAPVVRPAAN